MKNLSSEQKQKLFNATVAFVLAVFAIFGYGLGLSIPVSTAPAPIVASGQSIQGAIDTKALVVRTTSHLIGAVTIDGALTQSGAQTAGAPLNMANYAINNIGNAGTDFDASGGLQTAGNITDSGTLSVTGASTFIGALTGTSATFSVDAQARNITATGTLSVVGTSALGVASFAGATDFNAAMNVDANGDFDSLSTAGNIDMTTMNNSGANPVMINDDLTITGTLTLSNTSFVPIDGGVITPTVQLYTLAPTAVATVTLAACTTGQQTIIYNNANFNVVISDTGNGVLAGAQTLGQYDALPLACFATTWVQVGAVSAN